MVNGSTDIAPKAAHNRPHFRGEAHLPPTGNTREATVKTLERWLLIGAAVLVLVIVHNVWGWP